VLPLACCGLPMACADEQRPGGLGDIPLQRLHTDDTSPTIARTRQEADAGASDAGDSPFPGDAGASQVMTRLYETQCDADSWVQWGFFTYDATTPGDSSVHFQIRTGNTEAALATAPWIDLATAHASPNTQRCSMGGPAPCPLDLYVLLGGKTSPAIHHELAQVEVTLQASSGQSELPSVEGWQLTYSCPLIQ